MLYFPYYVRCGYLRDSEKFISVGYDFFHQALAGISDMDFWQVLRVNDWNDSVVVAQSAEVL